MIIKSHFNGKDLKFVDTSKLSKGSNIFTVIVGKNATGKSTLLNLVVLECVQNKSNYYEQSELGFPNFKLNKKNSINFDTRPKSIIAVSASPFDKFPIHRDFNMPISELKRISVKEYSYLGLRDLQGMNFGLAYMSKIISSLLESLIQKPTQITAIKKVLTYLGYDNHMVIRFRARIRTSDIKELIEDYENDKHNFQEKFSQIMSDKGLRPSRSFYMSYNGEIRRENIDLFFSVIKDILSSLNNIRSIDIEISDEIRNLRKFDVIFRNIGVLIQSGLFLLDDILLRNSNSEFSLGKASSGEQSVILSILGIASKITDDSLICIDEPEICLHPQWQEKYMQMLISTFQEYKNCHFLIATHSPQIISNLKTDNCFILFMETGEIRSADAFVGNSADFQLANVFNSPGFKNEYLSRIALKMFVKQVRVKKFDAEDILIMEILEKQSIYLEKDDPVLDLFKALKNMYNTLYGRY